MGQKPDDWRAVSLCAYHHNYQHVVGEETFWRDEAPGVDPERLIAEFIKASPRKHQIEQEMRERAHG